MCFKCFKVLPIKRETAPLKTVYSTTEATTKTFATEEQVIPYHATTTKAPLHTEVLCGGVCGRAVNTSNSGESGRPGFKPRRSRCFLRQETLLRFVSLHPRV